MLLRVVRGRVSGGREKEFVDVTRRQTVTRARTPGLISFMGGYRRVARSEHFLLASVWQDEDSVNASVGDDPIGHPASMTVLADVATIDRVDHFELIGPLRRGILDAPGAIVRTLDANVVPGKLPRLLEWVMEKERELNLQRSLLGWCAGYRPGEAAEAICSVSAWASPLQIEQAAEPGRSSTTLFAELDSLMTDTRVEHYQSIEMNLPASLADTGSVRIIAARFSGADAAATAVAAVEDSFPSAREAGVYVAGLGGAGTASQQLLVARVSLADHFGAERLITDMGGEVLYEADEVSSAH